MNFKCNPNCNKCCYFRKDPRLTERAEQHFKKFMLNQFGVFYLFPMRRFSITIWPHERLILDREAKKKNISLKFIPKRVIFDKTTKRNIVLDYSIDHDVCPFLKPGENGCLIYNKRPFVCRAFPYLRKFDFETIIGNCPYVDKKKDYKNLDRYIEIQERMISYEKKLIRKYVDFENREVIDTKQYTDFLDFLSQKQKK